MFEAQRSVLVKFVRKCRRYFPPGTAAEVWEQFKGPLASPLQPMGFEVAALASLCAHAHGTAKMLCYGNSLLVTAAVPLLNMSPTLQGVDTVRVGNIVMKVRDAFLAFQLPGRHR